MPRAGIILLSYFLAYELIKILTNCGDSESTKFYIVAKIIVKCKSIMPVFYFDKHEK
jgi:hypothetical protein